jgi:hypothetical protein
MVVVNMILMPPKAIGRNFCLRAKSPFELLKNLKLKRHPNIEKKKNKKKTKDFMKVKERAVYHNKYDSHCIKTLTPKLPFSMDFLFF